MTAVKDYIDMIDWWNLQPRWFKRLRLFLSIVWRMHESARMTWALSWEIALVIYPVLRKGRA